MDHVALIPRDKFVELFSQPKLFASVFAEKAADLAKEWKRENGGSDKVGVRTPFERSYDGFAHVFPGQGSDHRGQTKTERSVYEVSLNTWGFTNAHMSDERPPRLTTADIRVSTDLVTPLPNFEQVRPPTFSSS
jgi:hypothetical protein